MTDVTTQTPSKPALYSKTLWTNAILAVLALFVPGAKDYLQAHPELLTVIFTVANIALRIVTKQPLTLTD